MDSREFIAMAKMAVAGVYNEKAKTSGDKQIETDNVYVVWCAKVLKNNKAILAADGVHGQLFEITYDGEMEVFYLDRYEKAENMLIPVEDE